MITKHTGTDSPLIHKPRESYVLKMAINTVQRPHISEFGKKCASKKNW